MTNLYDSLIFLLQRELTDLHKDKTDRNAGRMMGIQSIIGYANIVFIRKKQKPQVYRELMKYSGFYKLLTR